MRIWKSWMLGLLSVATVTGCAHPVDRVVENRAAARMQTLEAMPRISAGACDSVGQYIPGNAEEHARVSQSVSAAPSHR